MSDEAFASLFKTESIKVFPDYKYIDNKLMIIVKTWQKISYECPSLDSTLPRKTTMIKDDEFEVKLEMLKARTISEELVQSKKGKTRAKSPVEKLRSLTQKQKEKMQQSF